MATTEAQERVLRYVEIDISGCWIWTGYLSRVGRPRITYKNKRLETHRFSYTVFKGEIPKGLCICHRCDNIKCVNPKHLFAATQKENMRDCVAKGRCKSGLNRVGEKNYNAQLNSEKVIMVRDLYRQGSSIKQLAKEYNVSQDLIRRAVKGITWRHLL